jgi:TolB-like protein
VKGIKPVMRIGTLAVMSFDSGNAGKDVGAAISEIVRTEIAAMGDIPYTVVERIMLNKVLMEQELSMTGLISKSDALKVGKILYADYLVMGRIIMFGDTYRISASIVETNTSIIKKQVIEDVSSERDIPIASKSISYKLFDKEFRREWISEKVPVSVEGIYASVYTDASGLHQGGRIFLRVEL